MSKKIKLKSKIGVPAIKPHTQVRKIYQPPTTIPDKNKKRYIAGCDPAKEGESKPSVIEIEVSDDNAFSIKIARNDWLDNYKNTLKVKK